MGAVEIRVLGPLEVVRDGRTISLSSGKQRLLLALLASHTNEVLSVDTLVEGMWSDRAPATAVAVVQSYVSHLRKALEAPQDGQQREPRVLQRVAGGYRLVVDPDLFDATQFERLSSAGRAAMQEARPAEALELLGAGLALWRGVAFGELAHEAAIQPTAQRLQELHVLALEHRAEAAVALGRHGELVGELEALVAEHPLRERLWGQLMVCLYRSGRQAEALGAYQRLRRHLSEELGLEPSVELRHLESEILQHAPELDWFPTPAASPHSNLGSTPLPTVDRGLSNPSVLEPMMHPSGTVTFLFTDVQGSTRRWEADPAGMCAALTAHDAVLRSAIELHGGWCFKHTGDGVCAAFSSAQAAIDAAVAAQRALELPVRMGIATGECETRDVTSSVPC